MRLRTEAEEARRRWRRWEVLGFALMFSNFGVFLVSGLLYQHNCTDAPPCTTACGQPNPACDLWGWNLLELVLLSVGLPLFFYSVWRERQVRDPTAD